MIKISFIHFQVSVDFALVGINSLIDSDQKLTTTGYLTVQWKDELLTWTLADYNGITSILVPQNDIWRPDLTLDNGMESKSGLGKKFIQATVANDGSVTWSPYEVFETSCTLDVSHFPFDTQRCDIRFVTWMSDDSQVQLNIGSTGFYTSNFEENGKWNLESMSTSSETTNGKTTLSFTLNLRRKPSFYVLFLMLPAVLLSVLNVFVFVLPAASGEKIGYTIAVFLSYALFYTILSESLPTNSDKVSIIASYLFLMMFLATLAAILTITELRIYSKQTVNPVRFYIIAHSLTRISNSPLHGTYANSGYSDQTPQNAASDQGLHCLIIECSIKIRRTMKNNTILKPFKRKWTGSIGKSGKFHSV